LSTLTFIYIMLVAFAFAGLFGKGLVKNQARSVR
jgi:hypothetical protein